MNRRTLGAAVLALGLALSCAVLAADCGSDRGAGITVVGAGEVSAAPDTAEVVAGVTSEAPTAANALQMNTRDMKKLFEVLAKRWIANKDVQTVSFAVSPRYEYEHSGKPRTLVGYQATNQVRVTVRQLDSLGAILDQLVSEGANTVESISFSVADASALMDQARRKAMEDAKRRAELYVQAAGAVLGRVLHIDEQAAAKPGPIRPQMMMARGETGVPMAAGELEFRAEVTVTYAIGGVR
jgi:uncharacterized protein YggE